MSKLQVQSVFLELVVCLTQAVGESAIRKALEELQIWGLERRFTLYQYSSTAGTK